MPKSWMNPTEAYSIKAANYAKYRWDYAPEAVSFIVEQTGMDGQSVAADIGAGTGIMTQHLMPVCEHVYAVEPNGPMLSWLRSEYGVQKNISFINATSDDTGLPERSIDVLLAAQALHWFDAEPTKAEFQRVLADGGWAVFARNYGTDRESGAYIDGLKNSKYCTGAVESGHANQEPPTYYFGGQDYVLQTFPFEVTQDIDSFLGALLSVSWLRVENTDLFDEFKSDASEFFASNSTGGRMTTHGATEVCIGHIR